MTKADAILECLERDPLHTINHVELSEALSEFVTAVGHSLESDDIPVQHAIGDARRRQCRTSHGVEV